MTVNIKLCDQEGCEEWAQWKGTFPDKQVRFFCWRHRYEQPVPDVKYSFVGAVPGDFNPQP